MKASRLILLLLLLPLIALWGCEGDQGPAGPAGEDGTDGVDGVDGVDGNVTCLDCHSTETMEMISLQYDRSQHSLGEYVGYAGSRAGCAKCHSGTGYVEWAEMGSVDSDITTPDPFQCKTCHSVHESFEGADYALREAGEVTWIYDGSTFDFGDNSNVCAWCHQSRRAEPNVADPGTTFEIDSTHYGPHHGAMANVYAGEGFAEIAGSTAYPSGPFGHFDANVTCVTCHMGDFDLVGEESDEPVGGHTWWPNINSCQTTGCHSSATDFDIGSVQTDTQAQLDTLRDLLLAQGVIEWVEADGAYEPVVCPEGVECYSMEQAQAFFNWIGLTEDRSLGVHNPPYVNALLANSIEAITP